eukprot:968634-Pelagomonas_calceolata.AAC.2
MSVFTACPHQMAMSVFTAPPHQTDMSVFTAPPHDTDMSVFTAPPHQMAMTILWTSCGQTACHDTFDSTPPQSHMHASVPLLQVSIHTPPCF